MADNSQRTPGSGEFIRTLDKSGIKTEVGVIDQGGSGAESLVSKANPLGVASYVNPLRVQIDPSFDASGRNDPGSIIFVSPRSGDCVPSGWNDGTGSTSIDNQLQFDSHPTLRLDPQGNTSSGSTPGASPLTTGVVYKHRWQTPLTGKTSVEAWMRWSSQNNSTNTFTVLDHYNRDGTNAYMGRLWIDVTTDPVTISYLNSGGTYTQIDTMLSFVATHMYDVPNGSLDKAGMWSFFRLVMDFANLKYVGIQVNQKWTPLTNVSLYQFASVGARALHFGVSYAQKTSTRRYMHVARLCGRVYP